LECVVRKLSSTEPNFTILRACINAVCTDNNL
jgi:hypothetical protein